MRRCLGIAGLMTLMAVVVGAPVRAAAGAPVLTLGPGRSVFWDGGAVGSEDTAVRSFPLRVDAGGKRLRVAIDTPSREDTFNVDVVNPSSKVAASTSNSNQFNAETFVDTPAAGDWLVKVTPAGAADARFRMRAKLEDSPATKPKGHVLMLPNLKAVPPYEFGFIAPANPLNAAYPPDTVNPPLDVAGFHPLSCALDESAPVEVGGGGAHTCLRLTSGPINVGNGPFDMRFDLAGDMAKGSAHVDRNTVRGPAEQAVHYSDGAVEKRPAGTYSFHLTHAHFHTDQILTYELFSVGDPATGKLAPAGAGTKSGFCPADQLFGNWRTFTQEAPGSFGEGDSAAGGNCFSPSQGVIGLSVGWGDVYRWQRPGQYVEFGANPDGRYVVRSTVDKSNRVLETNEGDNMSYSYIEVHGESVKVLERGQGTDPWDPAKTVFKGAGPASADDIGGDVEVLGTAFGGAAGSGGGSAAAPAAAPGDPAAGASTLAVTGSYGGLGWGAAALAGAAVLQRAFRRRQDE